MKEKKVVSRRDFLKTAAGSSAVVAAGIRLSSSEAKPAAGFPLKDRFGINEVQEPTYAKDIVGEIGLFDPRMRGWALAVYQPGDGFYERFFEIYPELMPAWEKLAPYRDSAVVKAERGGVSLLGYNMTKTAIGLPGIIATEGELEPAVASQKTEIADKEEMAYRIKEYGKAMGAYDVKIGPLNPNWLYANQGQNFNEFWGEPVTTTHKTAISMAFPQRYDLMLDGTGPGYSFEVGWVYSLMAAASVLMAKAIAGLGYSARAHHVSNYHLLQVPVAIDAGLGEMGRMGYLIHPELGANFRLVTVSTDLPLAYDQPIDFGLQEFCENCKICAEVCPSGAIPKGDKAVATDIVKDGMHALGGIKKWFIDPVSCQTFMGNSGVGCGVCHTSCPWSKQNSWVHKAARAYATSGGSAGSVMAQIENLFYGDYQESPTPDWLS
jgi:reductive dehalogenase